MTQRIPATDPVRHVLLDAPLVRDRQGDSLQRQLLTRIRDAILDGRFPSGCRLPGSRDLAADLGVTVVDDGTMAQRRGSLNVDDEGNPTQRTVLIEDGILRGYMQDSLNARLMGVKPERVEVTLVVFSR